MTPNFKILSKFSATKETGTLKFIIAEPPPDRLNDVVGLYLDYFANEEAMHKAAGISKSKEAIEEMRTIVTEALKLPSFNISVCLMNNENDDAHEIIGFSIVSLVKIHESLDLDKFQPQTKEVQTLFKMSYDLKNMYNLLNEFNIDQYYYGRGVVVLPKYRGCGIAQEFLKVRRLLCKENKVPLTAAFMTSYGTMKAAERDGWQTVFELNFEQFGEKHNVTYEDCPPIGKIMIARYP